MFGQQQKSPFNTGFSFGGGTASTFGTPTAQGFGALPSTGFPAASSTPFAFGASSSTPSFSFSSNTQQQQPQQQPFGASSNFSGTFGTPATSSPFGQTSTTAPQTKSLFGQPTPTPAFGSTPSSLFGQPTSTGIFGQTQAPTPFGQQQPASTPFGQAQAQPTQSAFSFGGTTASSSFDATQGTGGVKYSTTQETDQQITTTHYAITAMPAYQKKSFEELRWEDYKLGRKGGQTGSFNAVGASPFSASTSFGGTQQSQSTGLFGGTQTSGFGSAAPSFGPGQVQATSVAPSFSFGSSTATTFGTGAPSFGAPASTTGTTTFSTPFGGTAAPTQSAFGFGAAPTTQTTTSLFGTTPTSAAPTAFTAPSPFGSLGAPQPTTTSFVSPTFGAQPTATAPTTGFPSTTTTGTSLFGSSPSLFNASVPTSAPSFSFNSAPATASSFSLPPTTSLTGFGTGTSTSFSTPTPSNVPSFSLTSPSFSGSVTPSTASATPFSTSLFPSTATNGFSTGLGMGTSFSTMAPSAVPTITSNPYGTTPLPTFVPPGTPQGASTPIPAVPYTVTATPEDKKRVVSNMYRVTPRSSTRIKPRGYSTIFQTITEHADSKVLSPDSFIPRTNIKSLVIEDESKQNAISGHTNSVSFLGGETTSRDKQNNTRTPTDPGKDLGINFKLTSSPSVSSTARQTDFRAQWDEHNVSSQDFPTQMLATPSINNQSCPKLTKPGYYTRPGVQELTNMSEEELSHVRDFSVGRENHGVVVWHGDTDVRGLNLDDIIEFDTKSVTVYPDDSKKPPLGQALNRAATIILEGVWPYDKNTQKKRQDAESLEKYRRVLEKTTQKLGAHFKNYLPEKGEWTFSVDHFSRYGIDDDTDNDEAIDEQIEHYQHEPREYNEGLTNERHVESDNTHEYEAEQGQEEDEHDKHEHEQDDEQDQEYTVESGNNLDAPLGSEDLSIEVDRRAGHIFPNVIPRLHRLGVDVSRMKVIFLGEDGGGGSRYSLQNQSGNPTGIHKPAIVDHPLSTPQDSADILTEDLSGWALQCISSSTTHMAKGVYSSLGRSFRVAFNPNGTIALPSAKLGKVLLVPPNIHNTAVVTRPTGYHLLVAAPPTKGNTLSPFYVPLLDAHLRASRVRVELDSPCPTFELVDVGGNIKANIELFGKPVWTLVDALWGESNHSSFFDRKLALTQWLQTDVAPVVDEKIKGTTNVIQAIFAHLTGRQVIEAVTLAFRNKELRLASLLSQLPVLPHNQSAIAEQLSLWHDYGTDNFIDEELLSLYKLLAGDVEAVTNFFMRKTVIDDWKRCFSLHLWYKHPANSLISSSLKSYDDAVSQGHAIPPSPGYSKGSIVYKDVTYQLLRLYVQVSEGGSDFYEQLLLSVIHPQNSTAHPMDYRLSWHLYTVLRSLPSLRAVPDIVRAHNVYLSYATQLEMEGLWIWALYVLLQVPYREGGIDFRCNVVHDLVARHIHELGPQEESFLITELRVPPRYIQEARAWLAIYNGQHELAFACLKSAGIWNAAHNEVANHLANKWLVASHCTESYANLSQKHGYLSLAVNPLFEALESLNAHSSAPPEPSDGLYYEYLCLKRALPEFKSFIESNKVAEGAVAKQFMELYKRVCDLSKHIGGRIARNEQKSGDMLENVCLGDISSQTGIWMGALHQCAMGSRDQASLITRLKSLPIPTDVRSTLFDHAINGTVVAN